MTYQHVAAPSPLPEAALSHDAWIAAIRGLRERIGGYEDLSGDGAGRGAEGPNARAVADAQRFLDLLPRGIGLPGIAPVSDGEVNFFWKTPRAHLDVGFYGDGNIDYYARCEELDVDDDGSEVFDGRVLPVAIAKLLNAL